MGIQVHFKGGYTIRSLLVVLKDKDNITEKNGIIDRYSVIGYEEYTGESARTLGEGFKEHLRVLSAFMTMPRPQVTLPGWTVSPLWVESHNIARTIMEAMYIT